MMLGDVTVCSGLTPPGARSSRCPAPFAPTASSKGPRSRSRTSLNRGSEVSAPRAFHKRAPWAVWDPQDTRVG